MSEREKIILFNFATRSRPSKMLAAVNNITRLCKSDEYIISIVIDDNDDETMRSPYLQTVENTPNVVIQKGLSRNKVHAINRAMKLFEKKQWDILVNMSDDMEFEVHGFDDIIRELMDREDLFLHLPDGFVDEKLPTMSIMDRKYYERFNYVYHPQYTSLWCDNEAMEVAISLCCYKYVNQRIFKHKHPLWMGDAYDKQMIKSQSFYNKDKVVYLKRKERGFPI
jgi:hypothetical protein